MEAEANRSLMGLYGIWNLECVQQGASRRLKREALGLSRDELLTFTSMLDTQ